MEQIVAVGGWTGPLSAIILCVLATAIVLGWGVRRDYDRDDDIDRWLSGDHDDDPPPG